MRARNAEEAPLYRAQIGDVYRAETCKGKDWAPLKLPLAKT